MTARIQLLRAAFVAFAAAATAFGCAAGDVPASSHFSDVDSASRQAPDPVGSYSQGCIGGAMELPETGPTWQAMRLSRNRNWGHPELIRFIENLSQSAAEFGWKGLYIGDMSQPRGGPMPSGHASHQIGLDVDIWLLPPARLNLSRKEREEISSISVRREDQKAVNKNWTETHMLVLKAAAMDPRVDRIFLTAAAKVDMCENASGNDWIWLRKIRPWYQHNYHFHVRLKCPGGALHCMPQRPTVEELSGSNGGCDKSLEWWVTDYAESLNKPAEKPTEKSAPSKVRSAGSFLMSDLPEACAAILAAK